MKRSPTPDAPVSPRLGYEGACVWDNESQVLIRYGGHNQGGGGEQGAEVWTFDLRDLRWTLKEPNLSPPGVCCNAQNVFEPGRGRYLRFPFFSGSHGWQWWRELYLNDSSVWAYQPGSNTWRNMRPIPAPRLAGLRCASWDSHAQVVVVFGGEGSEEGTLIYDPHANEWRWPRPANQPGFRSGGQMVYDSARRVHVLFGSQFSDDPHTWLYDLRRNEWRDAKPPEMPPTRQNDAVLAYDSVNGVVLAIIQLPRQDAEEGTGNALQTWAYDTGANRWTRLRPTSEPEPSGSRARQLVFAPELNVAILENCPSKPREQQMWTYRYENGSGPPSEAPQAPSSRPPVAEDLVVSVVSTTAIDLSWTAPAGVRVGGYAVERAPVQVYTEAQLKRLKRNTPPLAEPSVGAIARIGPFTRINAQLLRTNAFSDRKVNLANTDYLVGDKCVYQRRYHDEELDSGGQPYRFAVFAYRVRAVNDAGLEGGPSPVTFTIPSSPQWLFSKEQGTTCHLKWAPNPERGLRGYRVYRMDGRWDKDPISRLNDEPVQAGSFADSRAGKATRRYYLMAVDALGQEGFPSSPVWFNREWRKYYKPFIRDWHQ